MSVKEKMTAIADRLRGFAQSVDKLSLDEIAVAVDVAFMQGVEAGAQLTQGVNLPENFWDIYQANGNRTDYSHAFKNNRFSDETFKPKYPMHVTNAVRMFQANELITDLSGFAMDFSECCDFSVAFNQMTNLVKFGDISTVGANELFRPFVGCKKLVEIGDFTVKAETTFDNIFTLCAALKKVTFKGVIGQSLSVHQSPLNRASIESIVRCLSSEAEGKTLTLKSGIVNTAFETSSGAGDGESVFLDLVDELGKDGWNFSY